MLAETPWGVLGMTVCYDLRFPHLYRALAQAGADFLAIPSAFTVPTGKAHWQVLLRARAIENGCFVFAPAQCGEHAEGRRTYGHSLIVEPWGEVLADAGDGVGIVSARIDPARIAEARRMVPSLGHDRPFARPERAAKPPRGRVARPPEVREDLELGDTAFGPGNRVRARVGPNRHPLVQRATASSPRR